MFDGGPGKLPLAWASRVGYNQFSNEPLELKPIGRIVKFCDRALSPAAGAGIGDARPAPGPERCTAILSDASSSA